MVKQGPSPEGGKDLCLHEISYDFILFHVPEIFNWIWNISIRLGSIVTLPTLVKTLPTPVHSLPTLVKTLPTLVTLLANLFLRSPAL